MTFANTGYQILPVGFSTEKLKNLRRDVFHVHDYVSRKLGHARVTKDSELIEFHSKNSNMQYMCVKHCYRCPSLFSIAADSFWISLLSESFGFKYPFLEVEPQIRVDMPIEDQSMFAPHQDYVFNLGSVNSVTIWIPLQDTTIETGALVVQPGSHKHGILKNKEGLLNHDNQLPSVPCPLNFGEALIFDQKLVHMSGRNTSEKIRFSVQLRFTDFGCSKYFGEGLPINHRQSVIKYGEPYMTNFEHSPAGRAT